MVLRWKPIAVFAVVVFAAALSLTTAHSASATNNSHAWWECDRSTRLWSGDLRAGYVSPPSDSWVADTPSSTPVKNSFYDRAHDAALRWDASLRAAHGSGNGIRWVGTTSSTNTANIAFRETSTWNPAMGAYVDVPASCYDSVNSASQVALPGTVYININQYSYWFSQDDTRRAFWESCSPREVSASVHYTCSKRWDLGSVMTHEVGHALGLSHPTGRSPTTNVLRSDSANCPSAVDQATMCPGDFYGAYSRTMLRILHAWDLASLNHQY